MRDTSRHNGFTLIEIMLVIVMVGIIAAAVFYMGGPYINRSRDLARFADISQYSRVIGLYEQEHDALPNNYDPINPLVSSYCADEVFFERESGSGKDMQFTYLRELMFSKPTRDPLKSTPTIGPCTRTGSYLYSSFSIGESKYSLLGARMSVLANGNYLTGSDILSDGSVSLTNLENMKPNYKGTISDTTQGNIYYFMVTKY